VFLCFAKNVFLLENCQEVVNKDVEPEFSDENRVD